MKRCILITEFLSWRNAKTRVIYRLLFLWVLCFSNETTAMNLFSTESKSEEIVHLYIVIAIVTVISFLCVGLAAIFIRLNRQLNTEIKARQATLAELRENERNLRFITENSADVIWTMDIESGKFTYVSPSVYNLRGYTVEEVMAQSVEELMTPDSAERAFNSLAESITRWNSGDHSDTRRVTEIDQPHKDGHLVSTEVVTTLHANSQGQLTSIIGISRDITERKKSEEAIRNLAFYDPLTTLPNRRLLFDRLEQAISHARRNEGRLALMFIDLDKFKPINDQYGHVTGDKLLQTVARRMQSCLRESDTAARIGGDEFIVLLPEISNRDDVLMIAEKIRETLNKPYQNINSNELHISACIGIALYPEHGHTEKQLLKNGDSAMYQAKESGRNCVWIYQPEADVIAEQETQLLRLNWKKAYESGNDQIDHEHKELFQLAAILINNAMEKDRYHEAFDHEFQALHDHVVQHFAEEEKILAAYDYSDLAEHTKLHRELIDQVEHLYQSMRAEQLSMGSLIDFIIDDLVKGHLLKKDRKFYPLFRQAHKQH